MLPQQAHKDQGNFDRYIETLWQCKPLAESDVKIICDKVNLQYQNINSKKVINYFLSKGTRNFSRRIECLKFKSTSYCMW